MADLTRVLTPDEARFLRNAAASPAVATFSRRVDAAIMERIPARVSIAGIDHGVAIRVRDAYLSAGWRAEIVSDSRDGDYLEIDEPGGAG